MRTSGGRPPDLVDVFVERHDSGEYLVKFQLAGSNNVNGPFTFVGPDGTAATFFTTSPAHFRGSSTTSAISSTKRFWTPLTLQLLRR